MPDRIVAATAVYLAVPVISRYGRIRASNVQTVWSGDAVLQFGSISLYILKYLSYTGPDMRTILLVPALFLAGCVYAPETPLGSAAGHGDTERVKTLLARGADPNNRSGRGGSALIGAARGGHIGVIRALAAAGADPNLRGGVNGWTPLMHAIHKNQKLAAMALIDAGADPNARGSGGSTPLIMAAGYGNAETVRALLARGADPRVEASNGVNALSAAVSGTSDIDKFTLGSCQTSTVKALLESAPDLKLSSTLWNRVATGISGIAGCKETLELLQHATLRK